MKILIKPKDLQRGMFIQLPDNWLTHPFLFNAFKISTDKQIEKIKNSSLDHITVDIDKSDEAIKNYLDKNLLANSKPDMKENMQVVKQNIVPDNFENILKNEQINIKERTDFVYNSSLQMMSNLLENPSAGNIQEFKKGAEEIVDFILKNDDVTHHLLDITNYDYYTYAHSVNVGIYSILLARSLFGKRSDHNMKNLGAGFFLHDIGKVRISNSILHKCGELNLHEYEIMKTHTVKGYDLLYETSQMTEESKIIVLQHHERYDGSGYPNGLRGDEIHIYSKICSIADVFDALTSNRPYRKPSTPFDALKIMKEEMLHHFHKDIFQEFVLLFK